MKSKIRSASDLQKTCQTLTAKGERVVFTNGCFDILHVGHVRYLQAARKLGDALIVAVNSDASVRALKGPQRPINTETDRAEVLAALESVDYVTIFDEERVNHLLEIICPSVYAKGGDYTVDTLDPSEKVALEAISAEIHILPLVPGKSTSATLTRMQTSPSA